LDWVVIAFGCSVGPDSGPSFAVGVLLAFVGITVRAVGRQGLDEITADSAEMMLADQSWSGLNQASRREGSYVPHRDRLRYGDSG